MEIYLKKVNQSLIPENHEAGEFILHLKQGAVVKAKITQPRNYGHHKKYFVLLNYAYDCFEPDIEYKGEKIEKNFDRFRDDIQILAGYGIPTVNIKGEVRYISKSVSFGSMSQDEFEKLYSNVINVILKHVLANHTREDLDQIVSEVLNFA